MTAAGDRPLAASSPTAPAWRVAAEGAALTLAAPAIGWIVDPRDPFGLRRAFCWTLVAPLLVALRYGAAFGAASGVGLVVLAFAAGRAGAMVATGVPAEAILGLLAVPVIVGQASSSWRRKSDRLERALGDSTRRLGALSRAHALLELTHQRLREEQAGVVDLRDALAGARPAPAGNDRDEGPDAVLLELCARHCAVEVASLHDVLDASRLAPVPRAVLGRPEPVDPDDPLVVRAVASGRLAYLPAGAISSDAAPASQLLACIPALDGDGIVRSVLCVQAMPFMDFQRTNLTALAALAGQAAPVDAGPASSDAPAGDLGLLVARAARDAARGERPTAIAAIASRRGSAVIDVLDVVLADSLAEGELPFVRRSASGDCVVYVVFARGGESAAPQAFGERVDRAVRRELGKSLESAGGYFASDIVSPSDNVAAVTQRFAKNMGLEERPREISAAG